MRQVLFQPQPSMGPNRGRRQNSRAIIITAITLVALSGLLIGFTAGAFARKVSTPTTTTNTGNTPIVVQQKTSTTTPTVDVLAVGVGCPVIGSYTITEMADSTTSYTISVQAMDKSIENKTACGKGKSLTVPDMTCRLWLTKDEQRLKTLSHDSHDILKTVASFQQPFPGEETNAIQFNGTQQTQACSLTGQTKWKYQVNASLQPGTYYLAVLSDWKGKAYNWSWVQIIITKAGN